MAEVIKIAGIDPSINSSGKVIMELDSQTYDVQKIKFYGYNETKKWCLVKDNVEIECVGTKYSSMNMFDRQNLAYGILNKDMEDVKCIAFEGYSYSSSQSSSLFQIAEFCGGLKKYFYDKGKNIVIYPPLTIKKFATGKGNAEKCHMKAAFETRYPEFYPACINLLKTFESPQNDLIDAYYICQVLRCHIMYVAGIEMSDEITEAIEYKSTKKSQSIVETEILNGKAI